MKDNRTLLQGKYWQININLRFGVPGYLFVTNRNGTSDQFTDIAPHEFSELGQFLGLASIAVEATLKPERVLTGKFGMVLGAPLHFHVVPLHSWILSAFAENTGYHALQALNPTGYPATPDAAELIAYIWRAFCFTGETPVEFCAHTIADNLEAYLKNNHNLFTKP